eukprot:Pgem_evm1s2367
MRWERKKEEGEGKGGRKRGEEEGEERGRRKREKVNREGEGAGEEEGGERMVLQRDKTLLRQHNNVHSKSNCCKPPALDSTCDNSSQFCIDQTQKQACVPASLYNITITLKRTTRKYKTYNKK